MVMMFMLRWEFYSEDGDIEFNVIGKRGQYEEIVVPAARVDCHISKIRGQMFCDDYKLCNTSNNRIDFI